jgi:hypothetical protein
LFSLIYFQVNQNLEEEEEEEEEEEKEVDRKS